MKKIRITLAMLFGGWAQGALHAGPPPSDSVLADDAPMLSSWAPPVYPPAALKEKIEGNVKLRVVVDAQGQVTAARVLQSVDPRLDEAALAAVRSWKFTPGLEDGQPAACSMDIPIRFSVTTAHVKSKPGFLPPYELLPQPSPRTEVEEKVTPQGEYPEILTERKIQGAVTFACTVNAEGRAVAPRITGASNVEFVLPALEALNHWEFTPARQGDLPVKAMVEAKVTFDGRGNTREEVLAVNGLTAPDGSVPPLAPEPYIVTDPVWPYDLLMAGKRGSAVAEFTVWANGAVTAVKVREATSPEFGRALVAALETWGFNPALDNGRAVSVPMVKRAEFSAVPAGKESATDPVERLIAARRANQIGPAKNLDEKLTPIYRAPPAYPASIAEGEQQAGAAEIEFVIDREGRARLPRIVSATREEFGWAAATAVSQWVFKAPCRGGKPVDVVVKIPFEFAAPAK